MLYLASQFSGFLLAALALGFVMGWISHSGSQTQFWNGTTVLVAGVLSLGAALTFTRTLNGVPALWVESGLIFVAVYLAGCVIATLMRNSRPADGLELAGAAALPKPEKLLSLPDLRSKNAAQPVTAAAVEPAAADVADEAPGEKKAAETAREKTAEASATPVDEAAVPDAPAETFEGDKPTNLLAEAREGAPDDLELINGVGPKIASRLNSLGIWHFDQISGLSDAEIRYISAFAGAPGQGLADNWREDADILANGGETAHSRSLKARRKSD